LVEDKLVSKGHGLDVILDQFIETAQEAWTSDPVWNAIPDYKTRLKANEKLLEMMWYTKKKNQDLNLNFDLTSMIRSDG